METKHCRNCDRTLPLDAFSKRGKNGKQSLCKECNKAYQRAHYLANRDKRLAETAAYRKAHPEVQRKATAKWREKNPDYLKQWQQANPDKVREYHQRWYKKHPDSVRRVKARFGARRPDYHREHYAANKERYSELGRQWYAANKDRKRAKEREWRARNPFRAGEIWRRRRYRIRAQTVGLVNLQEVFERDKGICHICGEPVPPSELSYDHIIPISRGGPHSTANLAVAHNTCNKRKGSKLI